MIDRYHDLESRLWGEDREAALRIYNWLEMLDKACRASHTVDPVQLAEVLKTADRRLLLADMAQYGEFIRQRFQGEARAIDRKRNLARPEKMTRKSIRDAVAKIGGEPTLKAVAQQLGVRPDSLSSKLAQHRNWDWR